MNVIQSVHFRERNQAETLTQSLVHITFTHALRGNYKLFNPGSSAVCSVSWGIRHGQQLDLLCSEGRS